LTPQQRADAEKKVGTLSNWAMTHIDNVKNTVMNLKFSLNTAQTRQDVDGLSNKLLKMLPEVDKIRTTVHFRDVDPIVISPADSELVKLKKTTETNIYLVNVALGALKREVGSILARSNADDLNLIVQYVKIVRDFEALV